jgi:hypothetical protein
VVAVGETTSVPLGASLPVQPPVAVHAVALVLDQVSVDVPPAVIEVGLALSVTVGGAAPDVTVTVTEDEDADVVLVPLHESL